MDIELLLMHFAVNFYHYNTIMLLGSKDVFAIEAYLSQGEDYVFIRYCFWVKSRMIGDVEQSTLLTSVIPLFEAALALQGQRSFPELEGYNAPELLDYFIQALWQSEHPAPRIRATYSEQDLKKANINSQEGESFQGFYTFLIEQRSYDWSLCQENNTEQISEVKIPKSQFYKFVKQLLQWITRSTILVLIAH